MMHGIGHFTFGFLVTYLGLIVAWMATPSIRLRLYGPFLPFAVGAFACVPYAARLLGLASIDSPTPVGWNLFVGYAALDNSAIAGRLLRSFELDALLLALAYAHMLARYIGLVRNAGRALANKHFYVAMGAANGALVAAVVHRWRDEISQRLRQSRHMAPWSRDWFLFFPVLYFPFILWALMPDILHGSALLPKDVTRGPAFDVFYLHSSFERWEDLYPRLDWALNSIGSVTLLAIALGTNLYYVNGYSRRTTPRG